MGQTARELREMWRKCYTQVLDMVFEEFASQEIIVGPDDAMDCMEDLLERWSSVVQKSKEDEDASKLNTVLRFSSAAYRRDAHHYAVDQFYKTYFPRKRGGEPLPMGHLDRIWTLRRKGKNPVQIAALTRQSPDTVRKQLAAAEKRWHAAVERIEEIKRRSPHLVAQAPPAKRNGK